MSSLIALRRLVSFTHKTLIIRNRIANLHPLTSVTRRDLHHKTVRVYRELYWRGKKHEAVQFEANKRSDRIEWNFRAEVFGFVQRLQEKVSEEGARIAFTDKSYLESEASKRKELGLEEMGEALQHNEEIAQFGHDVMSPFVKSYLRYFLPLLPEDGIRSLHDFLLCDDSIADMSKSLGTSELILCPDIVPSEEQLARTLRAFVGTLAKENGNGHAHKFIIDLIFPYLQDKHIFEIWDIDSLSSLATVLQNQSLPAYEPRLLYDTGRNTIQPCFVVGLYSNQKLLGSAAGETIAVAEEMAAFDALKKMFEIRPGDYALKFGAKIYDLNFGDYTKENLPLKEWIPRTIQTKKSSRKADRS